jgi:type 1 fimbriae regulatory protein FimB/type 1 fimbriae regulatory protein FimE
MKAAGSVGRHRLRDRTLILVAYRHGLRVSELVGLKWDQVDLKRAQLHVNRLKNGSPSTHPIEGDELRLLRRLQREYPESSFLFTTERGGPLTRSTVSKLLTRAGDRANLPFPVHPHMLRHGTGYYLANKGVPTRTIQAYLGHKAIQHTVRYTELSSQAFRGLFR